jgi:hypothetical protein
MPPTKTPKRIPLPKAPPPDERGNPVNEVPISRRVLFAALLAVSGLCTAQDPATLCVPSRAVPFDTFMRGNFTVSVPLQVPVPLGYELADFGSEAMGYTYWMLPREMAKAKKSHELPVKTGYLYGKLSLDVGYDAARDIFPGVNTDSLPPGVFSNLRLFRATAGGHALLFFEITLNKPDRKVYALYVALNRENQVAYLTYVPPKNDKRLGDCHWMAFRESVNAVRVSSETQKPSRE